MSPAIGTTFAAQLARATGIESARDAECLVARIRALLDGGETDGQILQRLNGPARPEPKLTATDLMRGPAHRGDTGGISYVRTPPTPPARDIDEAPVKAQKFTTRTCQGCEQSFTIASSRGRYPRMGPCCRPGAAS